MKMKIKIDYLFCYRILIKLIFNRKSHKNWAGMALEGKLVVRE